MLYPTYARTRLGESNKHVFKSIFYLMKFNRLKNINKSGVICFKGLSFCFTGDFINNMIVDQNLSHLLGIIDKTGKPF